MSREEHYRKKTLWSKKPLYRLYRDVTTAAERDATTRKAGKGRRKEGGPSPHQGGTHPGEGTERTPRRRNRTRTRTRNRQEEGKGQGKEGEGKGRPTPNRKGVTHHGL
jgi:hypothetical protein